MFKAITTVSIDIPFLEILPDTTIEVKTMEDGSLIGMWENVSFDINPDEYVRITGPLSFLIH